MSQQCLSGSVHAADVRAHAVANSIHMHLSYPFLWQGTSVSMTTHMSALHCDAYATCANHAFATAVHELVPEMLVSALLPEEDLQLECPIAVYQAVISPDCRFEQPAFDQLGVCFPPKTD